MNLGKCYLCARQDATTEQLMDRDFPRDAVMLVKGTGLCYEHMDTHVDLAARLRKHQERIANSVQAGEQELADHPDELTTLSELVDEGTRDDILTTMAESQFDFSLTDTLAAKTGSTRERVLGVLYALWREGVIRHPWGWSGHEVDWWRLTEKGLTRGEKRRRLFAVIGTHRISDGSYSGGNY